METVFVEERENAFADPEFTGLFLAEVAFVIGVWCVGDLTEGV